MAKRWEKIKNAMDGLTKPYNLDILDVLVYLSDSNNNCMLAEKLKKLGFTDNEVNVYLSLLTLNGGVVSEIAKKADMNRSTAYVTLESLAEKGMVSISEEDRVRLYKPIQPERLIQMFQERVKETSELVGVAREVVPELEALRVGEKTGAGGEKYEIRYYEGVEGMKNVYEDTLTAKETIRVYASVENIRTGLPHYFPEYVQRRVAKGIETRALVPNTKEAKKRVANSKEEKKRSYFIPKEDYAFSPEINVYDDKVAFLSLQEKYGLIIKNKEFAGALKKIFELSSKGAEQLQKKFYTRTAGIAGLFIFFILWWVSFLIPLWKNNEYVNFIWANVYQVLALIGAIFGIMNAKKWGGYKKSTGKALLSFSIGLLLQVFGGTTFGIYVYFLNVEIPYPSIADIGFFGSILFYIYGAILLGKGIKIKFTWEFLQRHIIILLVPIALLIYAYTFFLEGYVFDWINPIKIFLDFAYPFGQTIYVLIGLIIFLTASQSLDKTIKYRALAILIALTVQYAADYNFLYQASKGTWVNGGYGDIIYMSAYFFMALTMISFNRDYFRKFSTKANKPSHAPSLT